MLFPSQDPHWVQAREFLAQHATAQDILLAPNEFLEILPGVYYYDASYYLPCDRFDYIAFHKGLIADIQPPFALQVLQTFHPIFANEVFVIYAKTPLPNLKRLDSKAVESLLWQVEELGESFEHSTAQQLAQQSITAAVITTQNREKSCLGRSLPQIVALNVPVVIVDDGSSDQQFAEHQQIANQYRVPILRLPNQRLRPSALNMGLSYWLADPRVAWISCFQDNVDVRPDLLEVLASIQHETDRPLLSGRQAEEHPVLQTEQHGAHQVLLKRSTSGFHLHGHRNYWIDVMPIPTPDRFALQENDGRGTDEDWWITAWAPQSVTKRGGYVACVADLVTPFEATDPIPSTLELPTLQTILNRMARTTVEPQSDQDIDRSVSPLLLQPELDSVDLAIAQLTSEEPAPELNESHLSLDGAKVLIDGFNLQLTQGTGIKTYGLSLIKALTALNANVDVLLSRGGNSANAILDEVYFYDNLEKNPSLLFVLKGLLKTASGPLYRARRRKSVGDYVIKRGQFNDDFMKYATSFNLPRCYDLANVLHKALRIQTKITVPEKLDIWHATYPLPINIRGVKKITTVHDMIPLRLPYATLDNKADFYYKVKESLKDSAVTIAVSEQSKADILDYYDVDPDRIIVTYQPIALDRLQASTQEVTFYLKRFGLSYQKYLLFVGAIEPKKNVGRLLDAYASSSLEMPLIIVGKKGWLWEDEIGKLGFLLEGESKKRVKLLEYVSADALRFLYRGAYCLVFPSLYEGFGLPPVEAMNYGCPVITSNVSCLPEICGDAALYVDPYDVRDIKERMEDLVGDRPLRDQLAKVGRGVAQRYSMENYLQRLHQAYTKALS
jgi:glycosyltransferase involved in cell wall biosynthesis